MTIKDDEVRDELARVVEERRDRTRERRASVAAELAQSERHCERLRARLVDLDAEAAAWDVVAAEHRRDEAADPGGRS